MDKNSRKNTSFPGSRRREYPASGYELIVTVTPVNNNDQYDNFSFALFYRKSSNIELSLRKSPIGLYLQKFQIKRGRDTGSELLPKKSQEEDKQVDDGNIKTLSEEKEEYYKTYLQEILNTL